MKQLLAGIVLLIVLGFAGFLYRNEVERPLQNPLLIPSATGNQACTDEAKVCPDGSAVGRTGPNCAFATCALPNIEIPLASSTIGFVLPQGYVQLEQGAPNQTTLSIYHKPAAASDATSADDGVITISDYVTPAGQTGESVMLQNTIFDPSGQTATSTSDFKQQTVGRNTFWVAQIGRFEGQVETSYFLIRTNDVLRFDITEKNVTSSTDPNLDISTLPEHESFLDMLGTLQISQSS